MTADELIHILLDLPSDTDIWIFSENSYSSPVISTKTYATSNLYLVPDEPMLPEKDAHATCEHTIELQESILV